jgi:hypothetical protein
MPLALPVWTEHKTQGRKNGQLFIRLKNCGMYITYSGYPVHRYYRTTVASDDIKNENRYGEEFPLKFCDDKMKKPVSS